jgi:peptidoglycan/xylan/chitin deacetylase (PgdA/CDA1 family)
MSLGRILFLSSSVALFVLSALALLYPAVALWPVLAAAAAYLGVILIGVMTPRLAMFAPVVCRAPSGRPEIALTFDDGPSPASTPKVLAELARHNARATFFVLGAKAEKHAEVLRAIAAAGHEIGLHGHEHDRFLSLRSPRRIEGELRRARSVVESLTGQVPRLFRPPIGHVSPRTAVAARRLDLALIGWNVRACDGLAGTTAAKVLRRVVAGLLPGAIVLLHDASEREQHEPASLAVLPQILAEAARRGLACVTVSQALSPPAHP